MASYRLKLAAYFIVAFVAAFALYQARQAIDTAREVDRSSDIRICEHANDFKREANARNETLERTAILVSKSLTIMRRAENIDGKTYKRLTHISNEAKGIRTDFGRFKISDCEKEFPDS